MNKKVTIDSKKIKAVIFDMDGTIVNNIPYHILAWRKFAEKLHISFTLEEFFRDLSGRTMHAIIMQKCGPVLPKKTEQKYGREKELLYRHLYRHHIAPIPGLEILLQDLRRAGIKIALASGAPKRNVDFILEGLQLAKAFDVALDSGHLRHGKPYPDIFLHAAKKLKVPAKRCLVFEDSNQGIKAARRAGMQVVGMVPKDIPDFLGRMRKIKDFRDVAVIT